MQIMAGHHQLRGIVVKNQDKVKWITLNRIVSINHRSTAAKVTAEININLEAVSTKSLARASQN
jgi:hypothetical protein